METIIESRSSYSASKWMKVFLLLFGLYCIYSSFSEFAIHKLILAIAAFYGIIYKKRIYVSSEGLVKEVKGILGTSVEFFPWQEVKAVTFSFKGDAMMVFFERGITGWKILFKREEEALLKELLSKYAPKAGIDFIGDSSPNSREKKHKGG
ncbi:MAG: hypothetical protein WBJ85_01635 [Acetomicrobium sp.]|uniref:hypothetical protein n=1 Tax=Acetomicrobium TaxID=49894 RepID=UPI0026EEF78F|nr:MULTISPECIES: hypothetical protein [Acetomicrobium]HOM96992.1 hypothetical protein [Acetomicrobium sp.]HPT64738.1 hypothetical protein [Acetomicrobium sp.]